MDGIFQLCNHPPCSALSCVLWRRSPYWCLCKIEFRNCHFVIGGGGGGAISTPDVPPSGQRPRKWASTVGEGSPTAGMGCPLGCTWPTARAVGLQCVDATQSSETGAVWGSVGTTSQGKGRLCTEVIGQAVRGRAQGGGRTMGAATCGGKRFKGRAAISGEKRTDGTSCRQQHNQASCQPPNPPSRHYTLVV